MKAQKKHRITVPTLAAINRSVSYRLEGFLASIPLEFIIDTGAPVSLLRMSTWRQALHRDSSLVMDKWVGDRLVGVGGTPFNIVGVGPSYTLTGIPTPLDASMLVVEELAVEAILGLDFLERHKFAIGCEHRTNC